MARYRGSVCRLCRREGTKLFLKGDRCFSEKCAIEKRAYPPGVHGQGRVRFSDYGVQLREKQKVKRMYGLLENQFRSTYQRAAGMKGRSGENLLMLLERRLDNVVYRLGYATSRAEARQLVKHGHFEIDGKKVKSPSIVVKPGMAITVRPVSEKVERISGALETLESRSVPQWLEIDPDTRRGVVKEMPNREDITLPIDEQLIVELYSR
ncbi:MAG: 30S ribosomal protein S4 [Spirochaeta sp.]|jgi:small subunit ribosomal protein S4|nr:30S ribosomal protein S4 [Spirochaeta sp.]RPG05849.1 MAG: 30S ribosomal protein S4 [Proteobacteria bacterium TMED72]